MTNLEQRTRMKNEFLRLVQLGRTVGTYSGAGGANGRRCHEVNGEKVGALIDELEQFIRTSPPGVLHELFDAVFMENANKYTY